MLRYDSISFLYRPPSPSLPCPIGLDEESREQLCLQAGKPLAAPRATTDPMGDETPDDSECPADDSTNKNGYGLGHLSEPSMTDQDQPGRLAALSAAIQSAPICQ